MGTLKRRKKIKLAGRNQVRMISAPWVDEELIDNIKLRSYLNKEWKMARARGEPTEILEEYKDRYMRQKTITAIMTGDKKSSWESYKINETWNDSKKFWVMIKELLGKKREVRARRRKRRPLPTRKVAVAGKSERLPRRRSAAKRKRRSKRKRCRILTRL